VAEAVLVNMAQ
jgi:hypothetical protein